MTAKSVKAIVRAYLRDHRPRLQAQLDSFAGELTVQSAITRAGLALRPNGKRYSHQSRIQTTVLLESHRRLLALDFGAVRDFDALHTLVKKAIGTLSGAGELLIYDTALRIGAKIGTLPRRVYLHSGTRVGARALGLPSGDKYLDPKDLPDEFRSLKPYEIEDCLCIFKDRFGRSETPRC